MSPQPHGGTQRPLGGVVSRTNRRRWAIPAVALAIALTGACGTDPSGTSSPLPTRSSPTTEAGAPQGRAILAARSTDDLAVFSEPGATQAEAVLPAVNGLGSPLVLLVLDVDPGPDGSWVEVLVPGRPNGRTGWVPASTVKLNEVDHEVLVDLDRRELVVRAGDATILTTTVAIGDPDHPTPKGRFSITDKIAATDPSGLYGPFAFGLSGRSDVLSEFAGGDGQIGIHGTNDPSSIGRAASHGCIRVPNDVITQLTGLLSLGTPVTIV